MANTTPTIQPTSTAGQCWPHPSVDLTVTEVAALLGVARTTLSKPIASIKKEQEALAANPNHPGKPIPTKNPAIATAAQIFAVFGEGATTRVKAELLINALNIGPSHVQTNPPLQDSKPKEIRYRLSRKEIGNLNSMPPAKLLAAYEDALKKLGEKNRENTRRLVYAITQALVNRNIAVTSDKLKRIEGLPYKDFKVFATLAGWSADARANDYRLFAFVKGKGRPLDFLFLQKRAKASAKLVFMNLDEWLEAMRKGLHIDWPKEERAVIDKNTGEPKKPSKGPLRT